MFVATFLGGLAVGVVSAWIARSRKMPVAVLAFAAAVPMIPGLHMYRALSGALQLARLGDSTNPETVAWTLGNAVQASLVVSGFALSLILGARVVRALAGEESALGSRVVGNAEKAAQIATETVDPAEAVTVCRTGNSMTPETADGRAFGRDDDSPGGEDVPLDARGRLGNR